MREKYQMKGIKLLKPNKVNQMKKIFILIAVLELSCSNGISQRRFKWDEIYDFGKEVGFCQVEKVGSAYILSYSHPPYLGGGSRVVQLSSPDSSASETILFNDKRTIIKFVNGGVDNATFVGYDFSKGMISSSTYLLETQVPFRKIANPLTMSRRMFVVGGKLVVEGDTGGVTALLSSNDNGASWQQIDIVSNEYKFFEVLAQHKHQLLCAGGRTFNSKAREWFFWNAQSNQLKGIGMIDFGASICNVMGKENLVAEYLDGRMKLWEVKSESISLLIEFNLPGQVKMVSNVYYTDKFCIVSGKGLVGRSADVTFISENGGNEWSPFYIDKSKLVYNSFGKLIIVDNNKVLVAK